jgi:hypothetical protein
VAAYFIASSTGSSPTLPRKRGAFFHERAVVRKINARSPPSPAFVSKSQSKFSAKKILPTRVTGLVKHSLTDSANTPAHAQLRNCRRHDFCRSVRGHHLSVGVSASNVGVSGNRVGVGFVLMVRTDHCRRSIRRKLCRCSFCCRLSSLGAFLRSSHPTSGHKPRNNSGFCLGCACRLTCGIAIIGRVALAI